MSWDELVAGSGCPFDVPRAEPNGFWETVGQLEVSSLCLLKNQTYKGHCILIFDQRHAVRLDQLSADEWTAYAKDLQTAVRSIMQVSGADHVNVEAMGNQMPHLHWHIIPRYKDDPRWSGPIWTTTMEEMSDVRLPETERQALLSQLRKMLM